MPELPEVQTVVNDLNRANIVGARIGSVIIHDSRVVENYSQKEFSDVLVNKDVLHIQRKGKYIVFTLSDGWSLIVHLRMTGRLLLDETPLSFRHVHLSIQFKNGQKLFYHDTRKFGRWSLVRELTAFSKKLGMEPLEETFTPELLHSALERTTRGIKAALLDQKVIAGLGNIYVDEALWEAEIHPKTVSSSLTLKAVEQLHASIQTVLKRGLAAQGTTLGKGLSNFYRLKGERGEHETLLKVFRRTGLPCPRCGSPIERMVIQQRSSHFCPTCQKVRRKN